MREQVVDQFCGIGWRFAMDGLDIEETGIDNETTVATTRAALGWDTLLADIRDLDPAPWKGIDGLISSPPCQSWSRAGKGAGLDDPRGELVWQPLVWALACRPRWVACEQVPEARGAFEQIAVQLRHEGYHADVYELSAETFGVPQTRRRVFLVAHRDRAPMRPQQTHQRYRKGRARVEPVDMLGLLPWVSMAEALGDGDLDTRCTWMPPLDMNGRPSPTLTAVAGGKSQWGLRVRAGGSTRTNVEWAGRTLAAGNQRNRAERPVDEPAPTIPCHVGKNQQGDSWAFMRPSTTVCADPRVSPPVHHDGSQTAGAVPYEDDGTDKPVALTEAQGCTLMGFPPGTHELLEGNKQDRWRIIGNAVCPPVAHAVLNTLTRCEVAA